MHTYAMTDPDLFSAFVKRFPVLDALCEQPLDRGELEQRLAISTATSYRYTGWLSKHGLIEESNSTFALTPLGEVITEITSTFETAVQEALYPVPPSSDLLIDLIRHAPMLAALREKPLYRRALKQRLDISNATSHRFTTSLAERDLIERSAAGFTLTKMGEAVSATVSTFEANARIALHLAPVLRAIYDTTSGFNIGIFADATVTSAAHGDAYSPMTRFVSLLEETETVRGFDTFSIAPTYMEEFQQRIIDGMETEVIDPPAVTENVMDNYPEKCVQVCVSTYFTLWIHDDLPYGLVILDDRVGIGVRDLDTRTLRAFVDTDSPAAREWAEAVYESYKQEAVRLEHFTKQGLRDAMATV